MSVWVVVLTVIALLAAFASLVLLLLDRKAHRKGDWVPHADSDGGAHLLEKETRTAGSADTGPDQSAPPSAPSAAEDTHAALLTVEETTGEGAAPITAGDPPAPAAVNAPDEKTAHSPIPEVLVDDLGEPEQGDPSQVPIESAATDGDASEEPAEVKKWYALVLVTQLRAKYIRSRKQRETHRKHQGTLTSRIAELDRQRKEIKYSPNASREQLEQIAAERRLLREQLSQRVQAEAAAHEEAASHAAAIDRELITKSNSDTWREHAEAHAQHLLKLRQAAIATAAAANEHLPDEEEIDTYDSFTPETPPEDVATPTNEVVIDTRYIDYHLPEPLPPSVRELTQPPPQ